MPTDQNNDQEVNAAFAIYDQDVTVKNVERGCYLGMALMPAGFVLDFFVYPDKVLRFLYLRLLCSALIAVFWRFVRTPFGIRQYRTLGVLLAMFPTLFISIMIWDTVGAASPYYAGLNLVLLVVGFILHWTAKESLASFSIVLLMYIAACFFNHTPENHRAITNGSLVNNLYFIVLTGIIVMVGSYYQTKLRKSEFASKYELDQNRQELEKTYQKLVELDHVKSRFFANISHELRTPLTLLLAPLETMIIHGRNSFSSDIQELLATMQANGMRLLKLINDLLDLVRLESGKMEVKPEPVGIPDFVAGLIQSVKRVAEDKRIVLSSEVNNSINYCLIDRDKLEKILLNLVFNAIKFTPSRGKVDLLVSTENEQLIFEVRDTGMGISRENLANVFNRFWQADSSSKRKYQGAGIGLALVKELVEVQHGSVSIESEVNRGTTILIRLPYQPIEPPAIDENQTDALGETAANPPQEPAAEEWLGTLYRRAELFPSLVPVKDSFRPVEVLNRTNKPVVLVADDEPDMLRFLKSQLAWSYHVIEATDGQQAVEQASQFLPDIILLDMMMPEKDGIQVCREIRQNTPTQRIPIVLLTARADEETKYTALSAGASDFLAKPFSSTELNVRIKNLIHSHEFQRKVARQNQILEATLQQLKETETQLVQSEKLASLGRMSAGIIHEINNPLNFAKTAVHMLKKQSQHVPADSQEDFLEMLRDIEEGIDRVRGIVSDLRSFTHPNTEHFEDVSIDHVITSCLRFLSHEWKEKVKIQTNYDPHQQVWGNRHQLVQVVLNLLQNSIDAIKKKDLKGEPPMISIIGQTLNDRFLLKIRDNGPGIAAQDIGRIFDPFFTTKDVGEGMGLGLSICYRIMQAHEGRIDVNSELGKYCEFTLDFPAHAQPQPFAEPELVS